MIYLDNAATTKPSANAIEKASRFNEIEFFNPSALYHGGLANSKEINVAKQCILNNLHALNCEVIFTSCGTESDNSAIFCSVKKGSYVTTAGEHSAVYKSFLALKEKGNSVYFAPLNSDGSVNTKQLFDYVKNNRVDFVSIMHVNNETGAINDINKIATKIKEINPKIIFHSDGVQAYGKIKFALSDKIDFYSISAHKINGLKGVGALIKKKKVNLAPYIIGGGQENGLRSGTENVFGIKVFEYASEEHFNNITKNYEHVKLLNEKVRNGIDKENIMILSTENASPYILTVSAVGLRGEVVTHILEEKGIYVGNGSACSSKNRYSRVIEACGYKTDVLDGIVRISFSPENTIEEIEVFISELNSAVIKLKGIMY